MALEKRTRALWCKKAKVDPANGTLQDMIIQALSRKRRARDRSEPTSSDPTVGSFRIIAQHFSVGGGVAGIFTSYEHGSSAVSIVNDPEATQINIAQLKPPATQDGKVREWAEGLLYFYIRDNYVVVIQSMAVRHVQFEDHLFWLLRKRGERVGPTVKLVDQTTRGAKEMVKKSHIKSINVGGPLMIPITGEAPTSSRHHEVKIAGKFLDAVKEMLDGDESFRWADGLDGNLEATLHLTYKRTTNKSAQNLLDEIGLAMRNVDDVETELILNNGERIKGSDLKLKTTRHINADDGVLVADQAFDAMVKWLQELAEKGHLR